MAEGKGLFIPLQDLQEIVLLRILHILLGSTVILLGDVMEV
jgi:hypothetical protein